MKFLKRQQQNVLKKRKLAEIQDHEPHFLSSYNWIYRERSKLLESSGLIPRYVLGSPSQTSLPLKDRNAQSTFHAMLHNNRWFFFFIFFFFLFVIHQFRSFSIFGNKATNSNCVVFVVVIHTHRTYNRLLMTLKIILKVFSAGGFYLFYILQINTYTSGTKSV